MSISSFYVDYTSDSSQTYAKAAKLDDTHFGVVWLNYDDDGTTRQVLAGVCTPGIKTCIKTSEILSLNDADSPAIATLDTTHFAVI